MLLLLFWSFSQRHQHSSLERVWMEYLFSAEKQIYYETCDTRLCIIINLYIIMQHPDLWIETIFIWWAEDESQV